MRFYPPALLHLIKNFSKLPGIGGKTAERLAMHLLRAPRRDAEDLARSLLSLREKIRLCSRCFALSETEVCALCTDPGRDASLLCVVEQPGDLIAMEKAGAFNGVYLVLQGVLSPMDGIGPDNIRLRELIDRTAAGGIKEVVVATSTTVEGEATASYIAECLAGYPVQVTRIASGIPMGGDLKYVDQVTLQRAMKTRHGF
ncbi:MAG: recombination mediator RecR [Desulfobacterales bacterium]|nr:recombination mediator RecR [Desulfobacterales bacterium]